MGVGPVQHLGQPVEFGAEKENRPKPDGNAFEHTTLVNFRPAGAAGLPAGSLKPAAAQKAVQDLTWADLTDAGKSAYYMAEDKAKRKPILRALPNPDYADVSVEPDGWVEVISPKFDSVAAAEVFLSKWGWGHVHTSFVRGAPPEVQKQQVAWMNNACLYMMLSALERAGTDVMNKPGRLEAGDNRWYFAIKGLSIPTEDQLAHASNIIGGLNAKATPFSKHMMVNARAGKYGHKDRIGFETRGGQKEEKKRVLDSLLNGLVNGKWGSAVQRWGEGEFRMPRVNLGSTGNQVKSLPAEFKDFAAASLAEHPVPGLQPADAERLFRFVDGAQFFSAGARYEARLNKFDQRGCLPVLGFEKLPFLSEDEKARVIAARSTFLSRLSELEKSAAGKLPPERAAAEVASLIARWAHEVKLADVFGRWLDGGERSHFFTA
jgi:hypothetical protein